MMSSVCFVNTIEKNRGGRTMEKDEWRCIASRAWIGFEACDREWMEIL